MTSPKPIVLICSTPVSGHIIPMIAIAKQLVARGYQVCFVSGSGYRAQVEAVGASFVPVQGYGDYYDLTSWDLDTDWPKGKPHLQGPACFNHDLIHIFCRSVPSQHAAIQRALALLGGDNNKQIILMTESLNFGALPLALGAPGLKPTGFIAIGLNPILLTSQDHPPFGSGMLPDSSPEGRERNTAANRIQQTVTFAEAQKEYLAALAAVGVPAETLAAGKVPFLLDSLYSLPDRFVQMCTSSVEYPRSDAPQTLRFAGGYPGQNNSTQNSWTKPGWWDQIVSDSDKTKKKVIFVCQGTVAMDFSQLVLPSIAMLKHPSFSSSFLSDQVLLVISLGRPGTSLPADSAMSLPENCIVEEYIPYDEILPHVDVFVTTGGYGSFQRALLHGTPLVMAGTTEEKPESAARAEWAGVAVNLRTGYPTVEQLVDALKEVLGDEDGRQESRFKKRAVEIQREILEKGDPVGVVEECLEQLAAAAAAGNVETAGEGANGA